jgi:DNA-binding response OmpR family regulator
MQLKKILLIEDDGFQRTKTAEILELADYKVLCAGDGRSGVALAKSDCPDLILCDIVMPDLDGYGVLSILNKNRITSRIPFIFMSSKNTVSEIRKGMNLGADDYITKPCVETELLNAIRTRLKRNNQFQSHSGSDFILQPEFNGSEFRFPEEIISRYPLKYFSKKEHIYRESDHAVNLFLIHSGMVKSVKTDSYGKSLVTGIAVPGDLFGDVSCINQPLYGETTIAIEEGTRVRIIPKKELTGLIQRDRIKAGQFIHYLIKLMREREYQLLQMAYSPVRERVATALIKYMYLNQDDEKYIINMSREDLACTVGTTKESLVRCLTELKQEKIIQSAGSDIKIIDEASLKKLANGFR